jgi:RNA recognition motif-containing protein
MSTEEEAKIAMDKLNSSSLDGRTIVVKEAKPREDNASRGGYQGNNGSGSYGRRDDRNSRNRY